VSPGVAVTAPHRDEHAGADRGGQQTGAEDVDPGLAPMSRNRGLVTQQGEGHRPDRTLR